MLVMLPEARRKGHGVAFVAALPLIPPSAPALEAVEIAPDGSMHDVVTLDTGEIDSLHETTRQALQAATPQMRHTANDLERFAIRPGITLKASVAQVLETRRHEN